jgi:hypothetical protein
MSNIHSDWWCSRCNFKIFGKKPACGKCGMSRPGSSSMSVIFHTMAVPSTVGGGVSVRVPVDAKRAGDWACGGCGVNNFASRAQCFKCKGSRPGTGNDGVVTKATSECCVCMTNAPTTVFLPCAHMCTCAECAGKVDTCPICRARVNDRVRPFTI